MYQNDVESGSVGSEGVTGRQAERRDGLEETNAATMKGP